MAGTLGRFIVTSITLGAVGDTGPLIIAAAGTLGCAMTDLAAGAGL